MRLSAAILVGVTLSATVVHAQNRPAPIQIAGAAGYMHALYPELEYGALAILGGVRVPLTPLISFEPEVGYSRDSRHNVFALPRPAGSAAETREVRTSSSLGANVIVARASGRVRPFGGGGAGAYWERTMFTTFVPAGAQNAGTFRNERSSGARFGAQAIAGIDVAISTRVALVGMFRTEVRAVWQSAVLTVSGLGGIRVSLR